MSHKLIWLEVVERRRNLVHPIEGNADNNRIWQAQFACELFLRPAEELQKMQWGFNFGSVLEDHFSHMRAFLEAFHFKYEAGAQEPEEQRTLALRCTSGPSSNYLHLALVGKICAATEAEVRRKAKEFWNEIKSNFPYEYEMVPAVEQSDFMQLAGWEILEKAFTPESFVEIQRYENIVISGDRKFYILGSWNFSKTANEQIWRILANAEIPVLYDVLLRPAVLQMNELATIHELGKQVQEVSEENANLIAIKPYLDIAVNNFTKLQGLRWYSYISQIRIVSLEKVPEYIPRTIGAALTHHEDKSPFAPGVQFVHPEDLGKMELWRRQIRHMDPDFGLGKHANQHMVRVRKMADLDDAFAIFYLPFPSLFGLPDVNLYRK